LLWHALPLLLATRRARRIPFHHTHHQHNHHRHTRPPPNPAAQQNLTDAIALLDDPKAAAAATAAASEFMEFLGAMDYNVYFDQMGREPPSGAQQAAFVDFSTKALLAAQGRLRLILAAFDGEQMAAARQQTESSAAML
jgi:hypothetical protein